MTRITVRAAATAAVVAGSWLARPPPALAATAAAGVTSGELRPFAAGVGLDIDGRVWMFRTPNGRTLVCLTASGLHPARRTRRTCTPRPVASTMPTGISCSTRPVPPSRLTRSGSARSGPTVTARQWQAPGDGVVHAPDGSKVACADPS
jgi:hypothetical protein